MAISNATRLSDFGSGIGTQGAVLQVDNTNNRLGIGTTNPQATLEVGSGSVILMDGNAGVITATSFSGSGANLTGVASTEYIDAASITSSGIVSVTNTTASTSSATGALIVSGGVGIAGSLHVGENVSVGGTLTYEDVTNIDSVGVVTARLGVIATAGRGVEITAGGLNVTAGIATFKNEVNADGGVDVAGGVKVGAALTVVKEVTAAGGVDVTGGVKVGAALTVVGALDVDGVSTVDVLTAAEEVKVGSGVTIGTAGVSTFSKGVNLAPSTGLLREKVSSTTSAWSSSGDLNLDNGMVQYTSGNLGGTNNTLNITSSVGINTQMAVGEMIIVTGITSCSSSSAFVNALKIDHNTVQVAWVGGSAPSDGGGSGFDTYTFNIWKTASATYNVIGNQAKTS